MLLSICIRWRLRLYSRMPCAMVVTTLSCRLLMRCNAWANFMLYNCSSGGQSPVSSTIAKYLLVAGNRPLDQPLPLPLPFHELYCPSSMLGFGVASLSQDVLRPDILEGRINLSRTSLPRSGLG